MKKILIADDNTEFCNTLKDIPEEYNYEIHIARDGKETLKRIYTMNPDILLLDLNIPEMSGHEVCEIIRQDNFFKNLPIIAVSGNTPEEVSRNKSIEANEILSKPFDIKDLLEKLEGIIEA